MTVRLILAVAVPLLVAAAPACAQTWDIAKDFSIAGNPNGAWSYGEETTLGGPLALFGASNLVDGIDSWANSAASGSAPAASHNTTDQEVVVGSVHWSAGMFLMHPGPQDQYATTQLTLPTAGTYSISGAFWGADVNGTTTDVHIVVNGVSAFSGEVTGFGAGTGPSFALTEHLAAGSTIQFLVGYGTNGSYISDSTAVGATIVAVPEPASIALMLSGLAALALARRRRDRG